MSIAETRRRRSGDLEFGEGHDMFQVSDGHLSAGDEIVSDVKLRCLSLGTGVQSTTMALMAARGALTPMPDCAIFADTGWEPEAVYDHLDWPLRTARFDAQVRRTEAEIQAHRPSAKCLVLEE